MIAPRSNFWLSTLLLSGTIIGVGMFALPFVFSRAGFLLGTVELVVLAGATIAMNLLYGEVILRTPGRHLLPGLARLYLGKWGLIESLSAFVGFAGGLFVYILLGGVFLANLTGLSPDAGRVVFFAAGALLVFANLKFEAWVNYALTALLVFFILVLSGFSFLHFSPANISGFHWGEVFLPYGVILFSLAGGAIIPEMASLLGENKKMLYKSLVVGTAIPAAVYLIFILAVVGATGFATSSEALEGLRLLVGKPVFFLGNAIGFLALFTSFIIFGFTFEDILMADFGFRKLPAWLLFAVIPPAIFLLPIRDYVSVLGFLGAVALGVDNLFILWLYRKIQRAGTGVSEYMLNVPPWAVVLLGILFFAGLAAPLLQ